MELGGCRNRPRAGAFGKCKQNQESGGCKGPEPGVAPATLGGPEGPLGSIGGTSGPGMAGGLSQEGPPEPPGLPQLRHTGRAGPRVGWRVWVGCCGPPGGLASA